MINRMITYVTGKNLEIAVPDNSPLCDQEKSLVAGSRAGNKTASTRLLLLLKKMRPRPSGMVS